MNKITLHNALKIFLCTIVFQAQGQLQNNNWVFGCRHRVNFSSSIPVASNDAACNSIDYYEQTASVSHPATGQLLFYTDGRNAWNAGNQLMPNGTDLLGGIQKSCTQGALIVPFPDDNKRYYVFTLEERQAWFASDLLTMA